MLIDSHAHLNFNAFKNDFDKVIEECLKNNIWMINIGSQYDTSKRAVEITQKYKKGVYAAIGLHPIHLAKGIFKTKIDQKEVEFETREENFNYQKYLQLGRFPKVVAIGEIGLDYYYRPKTKIKLEQFKERQKKALREQLKLAEELNLPVVFHCRMAHNEMIDFLSGESKINNKKIRGVIHSFTGDWRQALEYLDMGFYLGFNGIIFKLNLKEVIKNAPLDKILIETDCPYLTPPQEEGRNKPLFVKYVAQEIARIKEISFQKIAEATTENAKRLFGI